MTSLATSEIYGPGVLIAGKYRLDNMLGEGGMGSVWAARNVALDSAVAIKLIRGEDNREDMGLRLLQEARAAAKLGHPAIVRVFDIGKTERGDPFIVMELLEGESLGARLHREWRLSAVEAVRLLLPIADALRAAHSKGIVHRDIKPDNVFLVADGAVIQPKLVDFGIAKLEQRELSTHQTERGLVVGSPEYMSPEQARGEEAIDHRSDIWSFCVLLYQAVSGVAPFAGANYNALLRAIVEEKPASMIERAAGDAELSSVIEVGMAKQREGRWRSIDELGVALASWLVRQGVFEDAAGGSLDARWLGRRSDSGRLGRTTLPSLNGEFFPQSGMAVTQAPPPHFGASAHAPTSLAPNTARVRRARIVRLSAVAAGLLTLAVLVFFLLRGAPPAAGPPIQVDPRPQLEPAAPIRVEPLAVSTPAAAPVPPPSAEIPTDRPAPVASTRRSADRGKKPASSAGPAKKSDLDLMTPY
jgi:serine/threonine-protein kinase